MLQFLKTRQWVVTRRLILVAIVIFVAFRTYGGGLLSFFSRANPQRDIVIARSEFRSDVPAERPVWIISLKNGSRRFTYDQIELQANYFDKDGTFLEKDTLVIHQSLDPLQEKTIASADPKQRGAATRGSLSVLTAQAK